MSKDVARRRGGQGFLAASILGAIGAALASSSSAQQGPPPPPPTPVVDAGPEVLTRGPVHEAFAEPVVFDPRPGPVVPKAPPAPIEEMPPDQKPEGPDVRWISGYWSFDDARGDFLWVSGIWREPPPGRDWVPGYWTEVQDGGYQWVPGTWQLVEQGQAQQQYLPSPPRSLEVGPNVPTPSVGSVWAPGCWYWMESRYLWRPGYWVGAQPGWMWIPAHYVWTPCGCLFVPGYWDFPLVERGVLFAPVYFPRPVTIQPAYVYTPTISIVTSALTLNLFVRPTYYQYYFGDYYESTYVQAGYFPWHAYRASRFGCDPIYSYYESVSVRTDPGWGTRVRSEYHYRSEHPEARPPRTFVQQQAIVERNVNVNVNRTINVNRTVNVRNNVVMARPFDQVARAERSPIRFERIAEDRRVEVRRQADQLRDFREQRLRREVEASRVQLASHTEPHRLEMPRSPIAARPPGPMTSAHPGHATAPALAQRLDRPMPRPESNPVPGPWRTRPEASGAPMANAPGHQPDLPRERPTPPTPHPIARPTPIRPDRPTPAFPHPGPSARDQAKPIFPERPRPRTLPGRPAPTRPTQAGPAAPHPIQPQARPMPGASPHRPGPAPIHERPEPRHPTRPAPRRPGHPDPA